MPERLTVSRKVAASPEAVYALISDVTRMGEWSDECYRCDWSSGVDGPAVGATFDGHNRHGDREWTTQGRIVAASPGREFAFECSLGGYHYSTWGYRIEADDVDAGCLVTEWTEDLRPDHLLGVATRISGVEARSDRVRSGARNEAAMTRTLARLAAAAEAL